MNTSPSCEHVKPSWGGAATLRAALAACKAAAAPSRILDEKIAGAVFPALRDLFHVEAGIWRQGDGARVRALLYSGSRMAAATLVPAGCWVEADDRGIIVSGAGGDWIGAHPIEAIALCIAALEARIAEAGHVH